jgi:hypothetical protein
VVNESFACAKTDVITRSFSALSISSGDTWTSPAKITREAGAGLSAVQRVLNAAAWLD